MFETVSPAATDCVFAIAARQTGPALLGLAVVALEAWLRMPLRPLIDYYIPEVRGRAAAWARHFSS